ncbi:hypothetical protein TrLO_g3640 [Triparma laevis f. longispina]|uniref:MYND-type domain-containing protein n=2 Tax=Triparma laevis TaxID=1534972 RepID=A0A9W7L069_9STRA|nr:hypothetical protein TrLO_g3640 [Triparma laevis f. longispina]
MNVCGFPGCTSTAALRCSRCQATYYCTKEHQRSHWKTHKKNCVVATIVVAPATPLTKVASSPSRGRYLVSARPIARATTILSEPPLIPPVLQSHNQDLRCPYCFLPTPSGSPHLSCLAKIKLNAELRQDFEGEATANAQLLPHRAPPTIVLAARCLRRLFTPANSSNNNVADSRFLSLTDNLELMESGLKSRLQQIARLVIRYYNMSRGGESATTEPGLADAVGVLARINQNGFTVADSELQPLGIGIYLQAATNVNHSCKPTMVSSFGLKEGEPPRLIMRTIQSVGVGVELSNAYIDTGQAKADRRSELQSSYCFSCECVACVSGLYEASAAQYEEVKASGISVQKYLDEGNFEAAARVLRGVLPSYEKALFANSPNLGIQLYKLCKLLEYHGQDLGLAAECRRRAEEILTVCYGEEDILVREIRRR